jgi:hypothetical protein
MVVHVRILGSLEGGRAAGLRDLSEPFALVR